MNTKEALKNVAIKNPGIVSGVLICGKHYTYHGDGDLVLERRSCTTGLFNYDGEDILTPYYAKHANCVMTFDPEKMVCPPGWAYDPKDGYLKGVYTDEVGTVYAWVRVKKVARPVKQ